MLEFDKLRPADASVISLEVAKDAGNFVLCAHEVTNSYTKRTSFDGVVYENLVGARNGFEFEIFLDKKTDVTRQVASPPEEVVDSHSGFRKPVSQGVASAFIYLGHVFSIRRTFRRREAEEMIGERVEHAHAEPKAAADRHDDRAQLAGERDVQIRSIDQHVDGFVHVNGLHHATFLWSRSAMDARPAKSGAFPICCGREWLTIAVAAVPTRGRPACALPTGGTNSKKIRALSDAIDEVVRGRGDGGHAAADTSHAQHASCGSETIISDSDEREVA